MIKTVGESHTHTHSKYNMASITQQSKASLLYHSVRENISQWEVSTSHISRRALPYNTTFVMEDAPIFYRLFFMKKSASYKPKNTVIDRHAESQTRRVLPNVC